MASDRPATVVKRTKNKLPATSVIFGLEFRPSSKNMRAAKSADMLASSGAAGTGTTQPIVVGSFPSGT